MSFLRTWWLWLSSRPDISGDWTMTVWERTIDGTPTGVVKQTYPVTLSLRGGAVAMSAGGITLNGWLEGHALTLSGRYLEDRRTTEEHITATVDEAGNGITGGSTWTWGVADNDPQPTTSGTTTFSAVRA